MRYASELPDFNVLEGKKVFTITGGGRTFDEYSVHQVEMLVKLTNSKAERVEVKRQNGGKMQICTVYMENGDIGNLIYAPSYGFTVTGQDEKSNGLTKNMSGDFFACLIDDILGFYETGKCSFESWQTLECMRIREMLLNA